MPASSTGKYAVVAPNSGAMFATTARSPTILHPGWLPNRAWYVLGDWPCPGRSVGARLADRGGGRGARERGWWSGCRLVLVSAQQSTAAYCRPHPSLTDPTRARSQSV